MEHTPLDAVIQAYKTTNNQIEQFVKQLNGVRGGPDILSADEQSEADYAAFKLKRLWAVQAHLNEALKELSNG